MVRLLCLSTGAQLAAIDVKSDCDLTAHRKADQTFLKILMTVVSVPVVSFSFFFLFSFFFASSVGELPWEF